MGKKVTDQGRRGFLRQAVVAAGATGAAAAAYGHGHDIATDSGADQPKVSDTKRGYHETDHIRQYYRLARF